MVRLGLTIRWILGWNNMLCCCSFWSVFWEDSFLLPSVASLSTGEPQLYNHSAIMFNTFSGCSIYQFASTWVLLVSVGDILPFVTLQSLDLNIWKACKYFLKISARYLWPFWMFEGCCWMAKHISCILSYKHLHLKIV